MLRFFTTTLYKLCRPYYVYRRFTTLQNHLSNLEEVRAFDSMFQVIKEQDLKFFMSLDSGTCYDQCELVDVRGTEIIFSTTQENTKFVISVLRAAIISIVLTIKNQEEESEEEKPKIPQRIFINPIDGSTSSI